MCLWVLDIICMIYILPKLWCSLIIFIYLGPQKYLSDFLGYSLRTLLYLRWFWFSLFQWALLFLIGGASAHGDNKIILCSFQSRFHPAKKRTRKRILMMESKQPGCWKRARLQYQVIRKLLLDFFKGFFYFLLFWCSLICW